MLTKLKNSLTRCYPLNLTTRILILSVFVISTLIGIGVTKAGSRQQPQLTNRVSAANVAFTIRGFEPDALTVEHQDLLMTIVNKSGFINAKFQLDRETGGKVHEVSFQNARHRAKQFLKLPPGRYILREASHPNFSCNITVAN